MKESGFSKLFNSIITSTIWQQDDKTRILWVTMLACSNRYGEVGGTAPGLARVAGIKLEDCRKAIKTLESPDPESRDTTNQGRRIKRIDGGYLILNYTKYRHKMRHIERNQYMRDYRNGKIPGTKPTTDQEPEEPLKSIPPLKTEQPEQQPELIENF